MAAPAFGTIGTNLTGTSGTAAFAVPASVAADDIIVVLMFIDTGVTVTAMPSGFAHAEGSPVANAGNPNGNHSLVIAWKRATGADSGTYSFTLSGSTYRTGSALRFTGAVTSGTPFDTPTSAAANSAANSTTTPNVAVTTSGADRLLIWAGTNWAGGAWTPPTGFTERLDTGDQVNSAATLVQTSAGSSGNVSGTCVGSDKTTAWLGALAPPGGGATPAPTVQQVRPSLAAIQGGSW